MHHQIIKYPVKHPLLQKYIKFFWTFEVEHLQMNHAIIPQRNINLRFNLSDTPHYLSVNNKLQTLEKVYFSGLHNQFGNSFLTLSGNVNTFGICFYPQGFYPFVKIPISEFKNQMLGTSEFGCKVFNTIYQNLVSVDNIQSRLEIAEQVLLKLIIANNTMPDNFCKLFNNIDSNNISNLGEKYGIGSRTLERMFNKYVGVSANTYFTLNRFHSSINRILQSDFSKLSDLAYDNGYFDQMHFIKDFKRFTGNTPKNFINQNNSILQIAKLS